MKQGMLVVPSISGNFNWLLTSSFTKLRFSTKFLLEFPAIFLEIFSKILSAFSEIQWTTTFAKS